MKLIINGREYDATHLSSPNNIFIVHKTVAEMAQAYIDFRSVSQFELDNEVFADRKFTGMNAFDSGENIQATYSTRDVSGIDPVMRDKAEAYDILTGGAT